MVFALLTLLVQRTMTVHPCSVLLAAMMEIARIQSFAPTMQIAQILDFSIVKLAMAHLMESVNLRSAQRQVIVSLTVMFVLRRLDIASRVVKQMIFVKVHCFATRTLVSVRISVLKI